MRYLPDYYKKRYFYPGPSRTLRSDTFQQDVSFKYMTTTLGGRIGRPQSDDEK